LYFYIISTFDKNYNLTELHVHVVFLKVPSPKVGVIFLLNWIEFTFCESKRGWSFGYRTSQENVTYLHTIVAGIIQLIKFSLSFSIYIEAFFYGVEGTSISIIL